MVKYSLFASEIGSISIYVQVIPSAFLDDGSVNICPVVGSAFMRNNTLQKMVLMFLINFKFVFSILIRASEIVTLDIPFVIGSDPIATV